MPPALNARFDRKTEKTKKCENCGFEFVDQRPAEDQNMCLTVSARHDVSLAGLIHERLMISQDTEEVRSVCCAINQLQGSNPLVTVHFEMTAEKIEDVKVRAELAKDWQKLQDEWRALQHDEKVSRVMRAESAGLISWCNSALSNVTTAKRFVQTTVKRLPETLIVSIVQQNFDMSGKKSCVSIEEQIQIADTDGDKHYQLYAFTVHHGEGVTHGHYVAFIFCQEKWWKVDDAHTHNARKHMEFVDIKGCLGHEATVDCAFYKRKRDSEDSQKCPDMETLELLLAALPDEVSSSSSSPAKKTKAGGAFAPQSPPPPEYDIETLTELFTQYIASFCPYLLDEQERLTVLRKTISEMQKSKDFGQFSRRRECT